MMTILRGVTYFKENKTKRATHLKAQIENHVTILGYSFQVSSTLHFNIFEISNDAYGVNRSAKNPVAGSV